MANNLVLALLILLFGASMGAANELHLKLNEGKLYKLGAKVRDVLITNPDIADVQMTQSNGLFIYGKRSGRTHIVALADDDVVLFERYVTVDRDLERLEALFQSEFPGSTPKVQLSPGRLMLTGDVESADTAKS
ncbi:MAG: pilus assembly protein N-terminal domain-containing protein, partial [Sneathiella sp.]|nr:pilus assembly protein N-terminal domain-containing protein [Sneathiella sp.]